MNYRAARTAHLTRAAEAKTRKQTRTQRAELTAAYLHCLAKSKTRKRSVVKLMAERGYLPAERPGRTIDAQWVAA